MPAAALLTATFIFPASLLRPVGGWFSDRFGARRVMYGTFGVMLITTGLLMMPNGHLVISHPDGQESEHLAYAMGLGPFATTVFLLGCAMGVGKAAVYKHIPEYFPDNVGSVGGLVGMFGGLGGLEDVCHQLGADRLGVGSDGFGTHRQPGQAGQQLDGPAKGGDSAQLDQPVAQRRTDLGSRWDARQPVGKRPTVVAHPADRALAGDGDPATLRQQLAGFVTPPGIPGIRRG